MRQALSLREALNKNCITLQCIHICSQSSQGQTGKKEQRMWVQDSSPQTQGWLPQGRMVTLIPCVLRGSPSKVDGKL